MHACADMFNCVAVDQARVGGAPIYKLYGWSVLAECCEEYGFQAVLSGIEPDE